jgi:hypothetical protein
MHPVEKNFSFETEIHFFLKILFIYKFFNIVFVSFDVTVAEEPREIMKVL